MNETTLLPLVDLPLFLVDDMLLLYDVDYRHPIRQYRLGIDALPIARELLTGFPRTPDTTAMRVLSNIKGTQVLELPIGTSEFYTETLILDCSLGGPSIWARNLAEYLRSRHLRVAFASLNLKRFFVGEHESNIPRHWSRRVFTNLARSLVYRLSPKRILVVGRELGARLFDLMPGRNIVVLETGFAETSIIEARTSAQILNRALAEVLFREATFPWDSVSHSLCAAESLRNARLNVIWIARLLAELEARFPEARLLFASPTVDRAVFPQVERPAPVRDEPLRILAVAGAHTMGPAGIRFLSLDVLAQVVDDVDAKVTVLTRYPDEARDILPPHVRVVNHVDQQRLAELYRHYDLYYRVQGDESVPIGCFEAMSTGLPTIISQKARSAVPWLRHLDNALLVPYGDAEALRRLLCKLHGTPDILGGVARRGAADVETYCDQSRLLADIGWSAA